MQDVAIITICGRLTGTPETKTFESGKSAVNFNVAVNVSKDRVNYYQVRCIGFLGDIAKEQLEKGSRCTIIGSLSCYVSAEGKTYMTVSANAIYPGIWKKKESSGPDPDNIPWGDDVDVL